MKHLLTSTIIAVLIASLVIFSFAVSWQSKVILNQQIRIGELEIELENRPSEWSIDIEPIPDKEI